MEISNLLTADHILPRLTVTTKKHLLQELARKTAEVTDLNEREVFDTLMERERLGTTGVGNGIAIPHGKLESIGKLFGLFARLEKPVDFDSIDDAPVDLVFLLIAPPNAGADHLKALARVSRLLRDKSVCEKLRGANEMTALYTLLTDDAASHAA